MTAVTVVTGAAGAMGAACARVLSARTDVLLLTDVDESRLRTAAAEIERDGEVAVHPLVADLGDPAAAAEIATRAAELGELHALVHTAGLSPAMAGWQEILRVDLVGVARLLDVFLPHVVRDSVAVCLASVAGHMGAFDPAMDALLDDALAPDLEARYRAAYGSEPDPGATYRLAKRAVIRLCERTAVTWGQRGGRVVSLSPGLIDTEMGRLELQHNPIKTWMAEITPLGARRCGGDTVLPGRADDIATAVAFLCSEAASFISGCDLRVDGGLIAAIDHQDNGYRTERGGDTVSEDNEDIRRAVADARTETGQRRYREVMVSEPPPPISPFLDQGVVDSVFGELWDRPGLSRRDRRWVTLACVGAAAVDEPIQQHVYAALASGDITRRSSGSMKKRAPDYLARRRVGSPS
jgi:NAD(P)-dependent dehydrogenase (short-subunit alcohol dehydrogenase family)/alkylhydroperoxidase/carboxymuconolactone decarboxylase family protein YurZ